MKTTTHASPYSHQTKLLTTKPSLFYALPLYSVTLCQLLFYPPTGLAQTNKLTLQEYESLLKKQQELLNEQTRAIDKLENQINQLSRKLDQQKQQLTKAIKTNQITPKANKNPAPPQPKAQTAKVAPKKSIKVAQSVKTPKASNTSAKPTGPVGQKPPEQATQIDLSPIPELSTNVSGVLTKKGTLIIEPALGYAYNDSNRVFLDGYSFIPALVVGLIDLREIKRHTFISSISARYGLTERWELDLKIPVIGRNDMQRSRPVSIGVSEDEIFKASGEGLGDIELATRYQLNLGTNGGPIYVANFVASIPTGVSPFEVDFVESTPGAVFPTELPTGSGYFSAQPSLTALYPTDPGVLFGNLSYAFNFKTDEDVGEVDPGDSVGLSFGLGFSLNERTSLSVSYSHKHVLKSKIEGVKIEGSELDIGQLIIGYSFNYSAKTNINLSLNIGVTDDAQDIRLNFRLPMMF